MKNDTDPTKYRIASYSSPGGADEFVVILSPSEEPEQYEDGSVTLDDILEIAGAATNFPCDRELNA